MQPQTQGLQGPLNRQTTLPPVGRGPRLRCSASPPSARGVCLIFSSYMESLTTMTGSELAGHRLPGRARRAVLCTALLARRGALRHPSIETPHRPALRAASFAPDGAQTPSPAGKSFRPLRGGQGGMIGPAGGIGEYPSGRFMGILDILHCSGTENRGGGPKGHRLPRGARCRRHGAERALLLAAAGEVRASRGRQRTRTGRREQADAATGGSVVCRLGSR